MTISTYSSLQQLYSARQSAWLQGRFPPYIKPLLLTGQVWFQVAHSIWFLWPQFPLGSSNQTTKWNWACLSAGSLIEARQFKKKTNPYQIENAWSTRWPESVWEIGPSPISASVSLPPSLPPPVSPLSSSIPTPPPHSSTYRTRRWIWNRCIVVWTVFWTRTWPTSRSPAPLSRSLRWTSAACSPARPLWSRARSPGGTTRPRASLWPPSSPGRGHHLLLFPILTMGGP